MANIEVLPPPQATPHTARGRRSQKFSRTRTGCLCCRLRRKKCDEIKPTCSGCLRNEIICQWSTSLETTQARVPHSNSAKSISTQSASTTSIVSVKPPQSEKTITSSSSCSQYKTLTPGMDYTDRYLNSISLGGLARTPSMSSASLLMMPGSWTLLQHFLSRTANYLTTTPAQNAFVTYLLPMAMSDDMIMNSVLALSASHLALASGDAHFKTAALEHHTLACRDHKRRITHIVNGLEAEAVPLLLTSLLFCLLEVSIPCHL